jgi:hypothetical protein
MHPPPRKRYDLGVLLVFLWLSSRDWRWWELKMTHHARSNSHVRNTIFKHGASLSCVLPPPCPPTTA